MLTRADTPRGQGRENGDFVSADRRQPHREKNDLATVAASASPLEDLPGKPFTAEHFAAFAGLMVFAGPHALELAGVAGEVTP